MQVMFDLDGTLTDSRVGVVRCIAQALEDAGVESPPTDELRQYVGPPLAASFERLLRTDDADRIERAIAVYRHRFERVGMFENHLYPGVADMLDALTPHHELHVVTAKPRVYAIRILEHFGLSKRFRSVNGPELGARNYTKESLIREVVARLRGTQEGLMVGDRAEDVLGAKRNAVRTVAVSWGYGDRYELEAASPDRIVDSSDELVEHVRDAT